MGYKEEQEEYFQEIATEIKEVMQQKGVDFDTAAEEVCQIYNIKKASRQKLLERIKHILQTFLEQRRKGKGKKAVV